MKKNKQFTGKLFVFGDIHGHLWKLQELFNKLSITKKDKIIFLGDYIDRGPDSKGVLDFVIDLKGKYDVVCLMGNHERFAVESIVYKNIQMYVSWIRNGGNACLESYAGGIEEMEESHLSFLENLDLTHETENHIFVHGWLDDTLDAYEQREFGCIWGRYDDINPHKSGKIVVCGHTPSREVKNDGHKVCIDTGVCWTDGVLTAMIIDGEKTSFVTSE